MMKHNVDQKVVQHFGEEWSRFDQVELADDESRLAFERYFAIFPWDRLPAKAYGVDVGCGTGRWATYVAPRVGSLACVEPASGAMEVARKRLAQHSNCIFFNVTVDEMPIDNDSLDFGYSLGVLHHIPDTEDALKACVRKLKSGAPFLVYLYYALDNKPQWYRAIWRASDFVRKFISSSPRILKHFLADIMALTVYFPLARLSALLEKFGVDTKNIPLSDYRNRPFYTMRTDALDRFGTPLEHRFTRAEIVEMMNRAGLEDVKFSDGPPFWCAVGFRK